MATAPDLERYRRDAEAFLEAAARAGDDLRGRLFSPDAVAGLLAATAGAPVGAVRPLRALARFGAEGLLREASAEEAAEIGRRLHEPTVDPGGEPVPLLAVDALLAGEPDGARRAALQAARVSAIEGGIAALVADARGRREKAARALGDDSPEALLARAAGLDLGALADGATRFLEAGDDLAARALDRLARDALGIPGSEATSADLPRLVRAPHLEEHLPAGDAGDAVARTLELLEVAPHRAPESLLAGLAGYAEALRETGPLAAADAVSSRLPMEARLLPDPALGRGAGALLEGLLSEPAWVSRVLGLPDPAPLARAAAAVRLLMARASAERVRDLAGPASEDGLTRALGLPWPAVLRLADGLAGLGPADDLRGRALGAAMRAHLQDAFGSRWFAEVRAGDLLHEVWLEGGSLDPEAVASELGASGLDPAALLAEGAGAAG